MTTGVGGGGTGGGTVISRRTALMALCIALRVGLANRSPITDCDEVYNYWEPLHFVRYGTGMQTWEYAPQFALRTYAYVVPMAFILRVYEVLLRFLPSSFVGLLGRAVSPTTSTSAAAAAAVASSVQYPLNKPLLFHMLRSTLALFTSLAELNLHGAVSDTISPDVADWTLLALVSSAGMFHAGPAYLPSTHVMLCWMCSAAAQLRGRDAEAIFLGLIAVLGFGWPFSAVLFVTTGLWAVWRAAFATEGGHSKEQKADSGGVGGAADIGAVLRLLLWTALHACIVQVVVMSIDYSNYGRVVSPTVNIFLYNTKGQGDELYGVEPTSYYVKNLLLNLNLVAIFGVLALPAVALKLLLVKSGAGDASSSSSFKKIMVLLPMYIWLAIVVPRPHKEERFLFPIYPMLCFGAAILVDELSGIALTLLSRFVRSVAPSSPSETKKMKRMLGAMIFLPIVAISISRSVALSDNYAAPLSLYSDMHRHVSEKMPSSSSIQDPTLVCVGGEWYRFPSSFHLPANVQLGFVKSSFGGQLPQPFTKYGSKQESATVQGGKFNDVNKEELDRYVDIKECSYVVELVQADDVKRPDGDHTPECVKYMESDRVSWKEVARYSYLDVERTSALHRILYLPWLRNEGSVKFKGYAMYERAP